MDFPGKYFVKWVIQIKMDQETLVEMAPPKKLQNHVEKLLFSHVIFPIWCEFNGLFSRANEKSHKMIIDKTQRLGHACECQVCAHVYMCICAYIYIYIYACVCVCVCVCVSADANVLECVLKGSRPHRRSLAAAPWPWSTCPWPCWPTLVVTFPMNDVSYVDWTSFFHHQMQDSKTHTFPHSWRDLVTWDAEPTGLRLTLASDWEWHRLSCGPWSMRCTQCVGRDDNNGCPHWVDEIHLLVPHFGPFLTPRALHSFLMCCFKTPSSSASDFPFHEQTCASFSQSESFTGKGAGQTRSPKRWGCDLRAAAIFGLGVE